MAPQKEGSMKTILTFSTAVLLLCSIAHADLAASFTKSFYNKIAKGKVADAIECLSGDAAKQFGTSDGIKNLSTDLGKGKLMYGDELLALDPEGNITERFFKSDVFTRNKSGEIDHIRLMKVYCLGVTHTHC